MLTFNYQNLSQISVAHGLTTDEIKSKGTLIPEYLPKIHARDQGFYQVIDDNQVVQQINEYATRVKGQFDDIVVLGIGGSALGAICLQQSLPHLFANELSDSQYPKLRVVDNIDPDLIQAILEIITLERTLFIVVTKSGKTPETLAQYFFFRSQCDQKKLNSQKHFVFITDPQVGLLRKIATEQQITTFEIPINVGGRFSALTAAGLLPAKLMGIDLEELLKGAQEMRDRFLAQDFDRNLPFQLAVIQYLLGAKGKVMTVMFPYSQKLIRLADWYRQLLAESIGKRVNNQGEVVHVGLTPINALGVTDQHSQSQLYNEGPNDKFFVFIEVQNHQTEVDIPNLYPGEKTVSFLNKVSFAKLLHIEKKATEQSLTKNDRPNITLSIDQINERTLGELFMLLEGSIAFLGEFYNINAFDQPGVELSKKLTKELLERR